MDKLQSVKLFQDIQLASVKYKTLKLKDSEKEVEDNRKLSSLLGHYKEQMDDIRKRSNFLSVQTREELKDKNSKDIYKAMLDLNSFSRQKYESILNTEVESTTVKAVMFSTIDELVLVNESIRSKEYLKDKDTYFYIYEEVVINSFMVFLALKDMKLEDSIIHSLSQSIFAQIQVLSIISM